MPTFSDHQIQLPPQARGQVRATCPRCSDARQKQKEKCLAVQVEEGLWYCHHCGWKGKLGGAPTVDPIGETLAIPPHSSITFKAFSPVELAWWGRYRISEALLHRYQVRSVEAFVGHSHFGKTYTVKSCETDPLFAYVLRAGPEKPCCKLYSPLARQYRFRYLGVKPRHACFGFDQLPESGPVVLLTGGEKDVLSLAYLGYPALALNSETAWPKADFIEGLRKRFAVVGILYDSDETGQRMAEKIAAHYGLLRFDLPPMAAGHKDISDYLAGKYPLDPLIEALAGPQARLAAAQEGSPAEPPPPALPAENRPKTLPMQSLITRCESETPQPKVFLGIPPIALGYVVGPPKSGKTTFCEGLAFSLAAGAHGYLDEPLQLANRKVLFFSFEEYWQNRLERNRQQVQRLCAEYGDSWLSENIFLIDEQFPRNLLSAGDWELLDAEIARHRPGLVVIDSLSRCYAGSIEESRVAQELTTRLRAIVERHQLLLLLIHHTPKQLGKPLTIDSIAGSRVLAQEADFALGISKTPGGQRYLKEIFFRYAQEAEEVRLLQFTEDLWLTCTGRAAEPELLREPLEGEEKDLEADLLTFAAGHETVSTQQLLQAFVHTGEMSKATLHRLLRRWTREGKIEKVGHGCYRRHAVPS